MESGDSRILPTIGKRHTITFKIHASPWSPAKLPSIQKSKPEYTHEIVGMQIVKDLTSMGQEGQMTWTMIV